MRKNNVKDPFFFFLIFFFFFLFFSFFFFLFWRWQKDSSCCSKLWMKPSEKTHGQTSSPSSRIIFTVFSVLCSFERFREKKKKKKIQQTPDILIVNNVVRARTASVIASELVRLVRDSCCPVYYKHTTNGAGLLGFLALVFSCYVNSYKLWI